MGALDNLIPGCSYDGAAFFLVRQPGLADAPVFGDVTQDVDRVAPYSFPAVIVTQVINTGLLDTITRDIAVTGAQLTALRAKKQTGYKSLTFAGAAAQSGRLVALTNVRSIPSQSFLFVSASWKGRP
jgi:hypothetical protein